MGLLVPLLLISEAQTFQCVRTVTGQFANCFCARYQIILDYKLEVKGTSFLALAEDNLSIPNLLCFGVIIFEMGLYFD